MAYLRLFILINFVIIGCVTDFIQSRLTYDVRPFSIAYLPLFDQRAIGNLGGHDWKTDWEFRRLRLELVDDFFRENRAEMILFDQLLRRSFVESDQLILSAGALSSYQWQTIDRTANEFSDAVSEIALLTQLPFRILLGNPGQYWELTTGANVGFFSAKYEQDWVSVAHVDFKSNDPSEDTFQELSLKIEKLLDHPNLCRNRLIVVGDFPISSNHPMYLKWLTEMEMMDTAGLFCDNESICNTESSENQIFQMVHGSVLPSRNIRILVHKSTYILNAHRMFGPESGVEQSGLEKFNLQKIWPSDRFGWRANIRLARCPA